MFDIIQKDENKCSFEVIIREPGSDGKDFRFEDFTPEQLEMIRGLPFKFEDFTQEQLEGLRGGVFTPVVENGILSWTNTLGLENPPPFNMSEYYTKINVVEELPMVGNPGEFYATFEQ